MKLLFGGNLINAAYIRRFGAFGFTPDSRLFRRFYFLGGSFNIARRVRAAHPHGENPADICRKDGVFRFIRTGYGIFAYVPLIFKVSYAFGGIEHRFYSLSDHGSALYLDRADKALHLFGFCRKHACGAFTHNFKAELSATHGKRNCVFRLGGDCNDCIVAFAVAVIPHIHKSAFAAGIFRLHFGLHRGFAAYGKRSGDVIFLRKSVKHIRQNLFGFGKLLIAADAVIGGITVVLVIAAGHITHIIKPCIGRAVQIKTHAAAYAAADALHTARVIKTFSRAVVSADAAAGAAAKYCGGIDNISVICTKPNISAVVTDYTAEHKACGAHKPAVYAFFYLRGLLFAATVFARDSADVSYAAYAAEVCTFADDRALFIKRGNTCGIAAAGYIYICGAAADCTGVFCCYCRGIIAADKLTAYGKVFYRTCIAAEECGGAAFLAIEVLYFEACSVKLSRECLFGSADGAPITVIEVNIRSEHAFYRGIGLYRVRKPLKFRGSAYPVNTVFLLRLFGGLSVPAFGVTCGFIRVFRLLSAGNLPFEHRIAAIYIAAVRHEAVKLRRKGFQLIRGLFDGFAALNSAAACAADRFMVTLQNEYLFKGLLSVRKVKLCRYGAYGCAFKAAALVRI